MIIAPPHLMMILTLALNYFSVSEMVNQFAQKNHFELIETMAERVAAH